MNYTIEETSNLHRTLPLSLTIGIPIVAVSYTLVNMAYFAVLSYEQILQAEAVALVCVQRWLIVPLINSEICEFRW